MSFDSWDNLGFDIGVPILSVTIPDIEIDYINSYKTLNAISNAVKEEIDADNLIFFIVDNKTEIIRSERNSKLSPVEYRSKLFSTLFQRINGGYYEKIISFVAEDGELFIVHIMGSSKHLDKIALLEDQTKEYGIKPN